jgi:hypothetical protein
MRMWREDHKAQTFRRPVLLEDNSVLCLILDYYENMSASIIL